MKVTQWFDGSLKPKRRGVYERNPICFIEGDRDLIFSFWDGSRWLLSGGDPKNAINNYGVESAYQHAPWRGLAEKPEAA